MYQMYEQQGICLCPWFLLHQSIIANKPLFEYYVSCLHVLRVIWEESMQYTKSIALPHIHNETLKQLLLQMPNSLQLPEIENPELQYTNIRKKSTKIKDFLFSRCFLPDSNQHMSFQIYFYKLIFWDNNQKVQLRHTKSPKK